MTYEYTAQGTHKHRTFAAVRMNGDSLQTAVTRAIALHQRRLGCAPDTVRLGADLAPDSPEIHGLQVEITTALSHPRQQVWVYRQSAASAGAEA